MWRSPIAPRASLAIDAPPGCTVEVDGGEPPTTVTIAGPHWVRATCPERAPWGERVVVAAPSTNVVAQPAVIAPPSDVDLLVQARSAGARAMIVAEAHGGTGVARLIGADGHERDRRTVVLAAGDLGPLAHAVSELLVPPVVVEHHWYKSRWAWAAGAAALAAAILVPTTAVLARGSSSTGSLSVVVPSK